MEGPSLVILREEVAQFEGKTITGLGGNTSIDVSPLENQAVLAFRSWGKHFIIEFKDFFVRIHFLMFGSYRVNERKEGRVPRLTLAFDDGEINFYTCSVKMVEGKPEKAYDWKVDLMSGQWSSRTVLKKLSALPADTLVCDALMNQDIFAGLGNIIKNEVLFNTRIHPESRLDALGRKLLRQLVAEARDYSFRFYEWKKAYALRKHWNIYKKRKCRLCGLPIAIRKTGKGKRTSYYCEVDQRRYV